MRRDSMWHPSNWDSLNLVMAATVTALIVCLGILAWYLVTYETRCPDGFTMIGDVETHTGVGPAIGGDGGVAVVISSSDNRQCIKVDLNTGEVVVVDPVAVRRNP